MLGPNQLLSETTATDTPGEWSAITLDPLNPGIPENERLRVLSEAALDSAEDARLNPKIVLDAKGEPHKAAEYGTVFSFQGELIDGPMTSVIIETEQGKMVFKRETSPEGETTFSLLSTGQALRQSEKNQPITPITLPAEILERSLVVPGRPVTLGSPINDKLLRPDEGRVTRITGLQLDEGGRIKMSSYMLGKATELTTDSREKFNEDMRFIRRNGLAPSTGSIATREATVDPVKTGWQPVSLAARLETARHEAKLEREKAREQERAEQRGAFIQLGLTDLSYAIIDRLISSDGVKGVAMTDPKSGALKSVYGGELVPKPKDGEQVDLLSGKAIDVHLEVFDSEDAKTEYWVSSGKMHIAWTSTAKPEGGLSISHIYHLDGEPTERIEKHFKKIRRALHEYELEDTGASEEDI